MSPFLIGILAVVGFLCTLIPAALTLINMREFHRCPPQGPVQAVSVLVPARNEANAICRLISDVLASRGVQIELLILDDESTDGTGDLVAKMATDEPRLQLLRGTPLPDGWCGKQFACATLAKHASNEILLFLDVDVSLAPDAINRSLAYLDISRADLVSGFPKQITHSFLEWLVLPLIHYLLLGYLPIHRSRLLGEVLFSPKKPTRTSMESLFTKTRSTKPNKRMLLSVDLHYKTTAKLVQSSSLSKTSMNRRARSTSSLFLMEPISR